MNEYGDRLRKGEWEARPISQAVAEDFIERTHYARGGSNTSAYLHGLFEIARPATLRGVAWWIPPTRDAALATYPDWQGVLALSRLAIAEGVPKNAATFLLARSRKRIDRLRWPCLVTYADEWRGHAGTIYLADNWTYVGRTRPEPVWTVEGRMVSRKAGPKTRTNAEMKAFGAEMVGRFAKHKFVHITREAGDHSRPQGSLALFPPLECASSIPA